MSRGVRSKRLAPLEKSRPMEAEEPFSVEFDSLNVTGPCQCGNNAVGLVRVVRRRAPEEPVEHVPLCKWCARNRWAAVWYRWRTPDGQPRLED